MSTRHRGQWGDAQIWKFLIPPREALESRPWRQPPKHTSSHPPLAHWTPPHWPLLAAPTSHHAHSLGARPRWRSLCCLESSSLSPFQQWLLSPSLDFCSTVVSSKRPFLTALPHDYVLPPTAIPAILIPLTLLCFSSQHLSPPANILFTG